VTDVDVRLLGPVQALLAGTEVALGGPRQRALLALLATRAGKAVGFDHLVDELWDGDPPDGAETTLRSYVSRLRSAFGDAVAIRTAENGYVIELDPEQVDAARFERLIRDAESDRRGNNLRRAAHQAREALELWRGRPFGELAASGALSAEADRLEEVRLHALELRLEADLGLGASSEIVDELEALVRAHPYREAFWRQLMLALYRAERQGDALAAYHRARAALDEQLGIEPGEELQALEAAILRHEVPAAAPPEQRHNLPEPLTQFVGRAAELATAAELLASHRFVTLTGVGGVGKTRLALEVARRAIGDHVDGVFLVDLAPVVDAARVASAIGGPIGVQEQPRQSPLEALTAAIRDRRLLLVLDNCEHLAAPVADVVTHLLQASPGLRILATSREILGGPGEVDLAVQPLALPRSDDPEAIRSSDAVQLFLQRVREARPSVREDAAALATAAKICADLDGLPLAMELAAARARALSLAEIASHLADRYRFLVSWRRITPARHRTLREAMEWSYQLLAPAEQELLAATSVFAGGFTLRAAAEVCLEGDEDAALAGLQRLVEASLLIADTGVEPTRYRLLETVRQYAAEMLGDRRPATEARHTEWVIGLIRGAIPDSTKPIPASTYELFDAELDNIRAAIRRASDDPDPASEFEIVSKLWKYWWVRGLLAEGRAVTEGAAERRGLVLTPAGIRTIRAAANLAWTMGEADRAEVLGEQARAAAVELGELTEEMSALNLLAIIHRVRGATDTGLPLYDRAIELATSVGNRELETMYRGNRAAMLLDANRVDEARAELESVLAYRLPEGRTDGVGVVRLNLGQAELQAGNLDAALEHFLEAIACYRVVGFKSRIANAVQGVAAVEIRTGRVEAGVRRLGAAAAMLGETGWAAGDSPLEAAAVEAARVALDDDAFQGLFDAGRADPDRAFDGLAVAPD
jgi:predicted ATPase/DNA-binding SARP family transcriptional activator